LEIVYITFRNKEGNRSHSFLMKKERNVGVQTQYRAPKVILFRIGEKSLLLSKSSLFYQKLFAINRKSLSIKITRFTNRLTQYEIQW